MSKHAQTLSIGELVSAANVNVETLRYYERRGLVPEPPRQASGYRAYAPDTVTRVRFIKRAQALGFTFAEIKELLGLRVDDDTTCLQVRRQVEDKLIEIDAKMRMLKEMQEALKVMTAAYDRGGPQGECPVLSALLDQESLTDQSSTIINQ